MLTTERTISTTKRILIAVDLSNLFYCTSTKFNRRKINYHRFLRTAIGLAVIEPEPLTWRAIAYGADEKGQADKFKAFLTQLGFNLRFKEPKVYKSILDGTESKKADWDMGIAIELIERIDEFDVLVLGSADGDMVPCVQYLKDRGKICKILACKISRDLREIADDFIEVTESLLE